MYVYSGYGGGDGNSADKKRSNNPLHMPDLSRKMMIVNGHVVVLKLLCFDAAVAEIAAVQLWPTHAFPSHYNC